MTTQRLDNLRDKPIFICGHPKAGTSLVRSILDSHPQLVVYPEETIFFRRYLPEAGELSSQDQLALADQLLIHIFTWNQADPPPSQEGYPDRDYSEISYEAVRRELYLNLRHSSRNPGDMLSAAILAYGQVSGQISDQTRNWVEKSPYNEYFSQEIFQWWPAARCIHVLRDPRDNYASYRRKHPDWRPEFFAANWNRSTQAGVHNQKRYGNERYLLVRYEELVEKPENTIRALADFLEIDWDSSLTRPTRAGEEWAGNSMFAIEFSGISAAATDRWKDELAPEDAAVIEIMTARLLKKYDYEIAPTDRSMGHSIDARWRAHSWPIRKRLIRRTKS